MGTFLIIVCVIALIFVAMVIFSKTIGKKNTANMEERYNNIFNPLSESIREKESIGDNSLVVKIITDTEDGVMAARDDEKKVCAVAWKDNTIVFPFSDYKECSIDREGKIQLNLTVGEETFPISISSGKFKNESMLGKQLGSMATKMKNFLDEMID
ncbi:MAG: hypothetical protein MSS69_04725 [Spirochaetales bacterium]|nr:hypothetical protein [Spirochaetales bacterium]